MTRVRPAPVRSAETADRRSFLLLLTASGGCAMSLIDTNVVALAVPAIASGLDASAADAQWIIGAFFLAFAAALLPAGAIADRNGRRRTFLAGLVALAAAALACGLAPGMLWMTLGRAVQGMATAFVLAPALALIGHKFHGEAERTRAWAIWGGIMGLTMVLAPLTGGLLIQFLGWRAAFFMMIPLCAVLAVATIAYADESRDLSRDKPDPAGIVLFAASMFGLVFGLISGQSLGFGSLRALAGFGTGAVALTGFILVERAPHAMLDLRLFRDPRFVGAVWAMFVYAATAQVMASLLPIFLQTGGGLPPALAGFAMMPFAAAMLVFPYVGARLGRHLSTPAILGIGLAIVAIGNVMVGLSTAWDAWPGLFIGMFVIGSGAGLLNGETQKAIMMTIPRERAGIASGISTTARFSGILLGFAALTAVFATTVRVLIPSGGAAMADAVIAGDLASALAGTAGDTDAALASLKQLYGTAYSAAFFAAAVVAAASALLVWRLLRRPPRM